MTNHDPIRRRFIKNAAILAGSSLLLQFPKILWAAIPTDRRLLVIVQRGAMDGLGAVPAIGDPNYIQARGSLAFTDKGILPLNGFFALNSAIPTFQKLYTDQELVILHAAATPYRERSHFEAQDLLENGSTKPHGLNTGWLGRTVDSLGGTVNSLAIGPTIPLLLQGKKIAESWSPSIMTPPDHDFITRVSRMYAADPLLSKTVNSVISDTTNMDASMGGEMARRQQFTSMMQMAANLMLKENGARIASIDIGGWDTHADQGLDAGRLAQALKNLSQGVDAFKQAMGAVWAQTAILVITEFGRTVMVNGSNGTDHGTASAAFLLGGNVKGGQIIGDWPGLAKSALYQERDLFPANDLRSLLKAALLDHLSVPLPEIEQRIFPNSDSAKPYSGLFRP